ncbi:hypothetical protein I317_02561 [Kwoniella heveanensis CBS 569]|uniref:NAD(P)-binding domain-containing protein n=1 Tax=Kwoniella heveanensis BCC8398 TaxID=1296120 RepID=A0A1B9GHA3_9TREE|nr:hypothetical protein I316_07931 [Kwoniella heveanensis BCC8398]OCF43544.1 hypothetical protein I317_02561 [Kwoniella heveanensis CBS 569]
MHVILLGASKGIGYQVLQSLLSSAGSGAEQQQDQWSTTLLLRKPELIEQDATIRPYIQQGRVRIVKGNATSEDDLRKCFEGVNVDLIISSIGATPSFTLSGIHIDQPELCTKGTIALLHVLQDYQTKETQAQFPLPRLIVVSSMGIGDHHREIPFAMRALYSWLLTKPHQDKLALEYLLRRSSTSFPTPDPSSNPNAIPPESWLPQSTVHSIQSDFLPRVTIVRPAMFGADGPARPASQLKVGEKAQVYFVRRSEVARFIVDECVQKGGWVNKLPVIGL